MKKFIVMLFAMISVVSAKAFEFDGIDLNATTVKVTRDVASKGYTYDIEKGCLKGICNGQEIYLSFNTEDVKEKNKIGQLIVDVPMDSADALKNVTMIFNVIYHQTSTANGVSTYLVDADGTTLDVKANGASIVLTYSTPNYSKK